MTGALVLHTASGQDLAGLCIKILALVQRSQAKQLSYLMLEGQSFQTGRYTV